MDGHSRLWSAARSRYTRFCAVSSVAKSAPPTRRQSMNRDIEGGPSPVHVPESSRAYASTCWLGGSAGQYAATSSSCAPLTPSVVSHFNPTLVALLLDVCYSLIVCAGLGKDAPSLYAHIGTSTDPETVLLKPRLTHNYRL